MSFPNRCVLAIVCAFTGLSSVAALGTPTLPTDLKPVVTRFLAAQIFTVVTPIADPAGGAGDFFGITVALSADGNTALVGAPGVSAGGANAGNAYVFKRSGGIWSSMPVASFSEPTPVANDEFGFSVALSADASIALVGTCCTAVSGHAGAGTVYVFTQTGGTWSTTPAATLTEPSAANNDHFGVSVALAGGTAMVGSPDTASSTGAAYIFTAPGGVWSTTPAASLAGPAVGSAFGKAVALSPDGSAALVGAPNANSSAGAAYMYTQTGGVWSITPAASLIDPGAGADRFGSSVAVSGGTALVGAPNTGVGTYTTAGEAYVYTRSSGVWPTTPGTAFTEAGGAAGHEFGTSVALSGDDSTALIGARFSGGGGVSSKTYLYLQAGGVWSTTAATSFSETDPLADANFTSSLALSADGSSGFIGSPNTAYAVATSSSDLLALTLASAPAGVTVGQSITYSLTVTNNSASAATNVKLIDTLPAGVNFTSTAAAGGNCNDSGATVTCTLASLAAQANWQPSITVIATAAGTPIDTAMVSADQADPFSADNSASAANTVSAATPPPAPGGGSGGGGAFVWPELMLLAGLAACRRLHHERFRRP